MIRNIILFVLSIFIIPTKSNAQDFSIAQNTTGNNRNDLRGQVFVPSEQEDGTGTITSTTQVYLTAFNVVYSGGAEAAQLYIYSLLPGSTATLDDGTGGTLVGSSSSKEAGNFPFTQYNFDNLELDVNTTYFALFRQDVDLEFGGSGSAAGPYSGGKMLYNSIGGTIDENDFAALRFEGGFSNSLPVNASDLAALKDLYDSTDGDNWTDSWDIDGDPFTWTGVTWENQRVVDLYLRNNNLVGTLPSSIGDLSMLSSLNLGNNEISGQLPNSIYSLTTLKTLNLDSNELTGAISSLIGDLINLVSLSLATNNLTGTIPSAIGNLTNLEFVFLGGNLELGGSIPTTFANLTNLKQLSLFSLPLTGEIPAFIWTFTDLEFLSLGGTNLSGSLSSDIGNLVNLDRLDLQNIGLTGTIPDEIGQLAVLRVLLLSGNEFTGSIPSTIGNLNNLENLYLGGNQLTGTVPSQIGQLSNLTILSLFENQIESPIPVDIGLLGNLEELVLNDNNFTGEIPTIIGDLSNLNTLSLANNQFQGEIPSQLFSLSNLLNLQLSFNELSGNISPNISNLTQLINLDLSDNQFQGELPVLIGDLSNLTFVDLSTNDLEGSVPSSIGGLTNLTHLLLNNNDFEGIIPNTIGSLIALSVAKFNDNNFQFDAFEETFDFLNQLSELVIDPQAEILVDEILIETMINSSVELSITAGGVNNQYQWFLNDEAVAAPSSSGSFILEIDATKVGTYHCEVTNTVVSGLTLESEEIEVTLITAFDLEPEVVVANATSIDLQTTLNKDGVLYYVLLPDGSTSPNEQQIINGLNASSEAVNTSGNVALTAGEATQFTINELAPDTAYEIYFVAVGNEGIANANMTLSAATVGSIAFNSGFPELIGQQSFAVSFNIQTSRAGDLYYIGVPSPSQLPTASQIKAGNNHADQTATVQGNVMLTQNETIEVEIIDLAPEVTYDFYMAAEDVDGFFTTVEELGDVLITNIQYKINDVQTFKAFPNPVSRKLQLDLNQLNVKKISLFNPAGKRILVLANPSPIDFSAFQPGIYILNVVTDKWSKNIKIVKE